MACTFRKVVDIPFRSEVMSKVAVGHFDLHPMNLMFKEASKDPRSIRAIDFDACSTMPVAYNFQGVLTSTKMSIEERKILVAAYLKVSSMIRWMLNG
jgi:aminoglycoside/choline kinase family phosphotransferase